LYLEEVEQKSYDEKHTLFTIYMIAIIHISFIVLIMSMVLKYATIRNARSIYKVFSYMSLPERKYMSKQLTESLNNLKFQFKANKIIIQNFNASRRTQLGLTSDRDKRERYQYTGLIQKE
jgi:hypothetical protein